MHKKPSCFIVVICNSLLKDVSVSVLTPFPLLRSEQNPVAKIEAVLANIVDMDKQQLTNVMGDRISISYASFLQLFV